MPDVSLKTETLKPCSLAKSMPRFVARKPASSMSKAIIRLPVSRFIIVSCSSVKAVPEVAIIFLTPSCHGKITSIWPSTRIATSFFLMSALARSKPYKMRLLLYKIVSGEFIYFPVSAFSVLEEIISFIVLPEKATTRPLVSKMGNINRLRKRSWYLRTWNLELGTWTTRPVCSISFSR